MIRFIKFLFKIAIIILAFIGFQSLGGKDFFMQKWDEFFKPSQEELIQKCKKIADLSNIPEEYTIDKSIDILGYQLVVAEHNASGQKMAIANPKKHDIIFVKDFKDVETLQKRVDLIAEDLEKKFIKIEDIKINKIGKTKILGKVSPYANFEAKVVNLPMGEVKGIFGVIEPDTEDGNTKIFVSVNSKDKYSQIIANQFFSNVK